MNSKPNSSTLSKGSFKAYKPGKWRQWQDGHKTAADDSQGHGGCQRRQSGQAGQVQGLELGNAFRKRQLRLSKEDVDKRQKAEFALEKSELKEAVAWADAISEVAALRAEHKEHIETLQNVEGLIILGECNCVCLGECVGYGGCH